MRIIHESRSFIGHGFYDSRYEDRMVKYGYGRLYYIKDSVNDDMLGRMIQNTDSSNLSDHGQNEKCVTIREGIWINNKLNMYGRTFDYKGNVYVG